jgi:hypothetical protein
MVCDGQYGIMNDNIYLSSKIVKNSCRMHVTVRRRCLGHVHVFVYLGTGCAFRPQSSRLSCITLDFHTHSSLQLSVCLGISTYTEHTMHTYDFHFEYNEHIGKGIALLYALVNDKQS